MLILLNTFKGIAPRIAPHLLPDGAAKIADNCKLASGALRPWNGTVFDNTPAKAGTKKSICMYGVPPNHKWLHWIDDVDVVRSPVARDTWGRVYWCGEQDGVVRYSVQGYITSGGSLLYPTGYYALGLPAPSTPMAVTPEAYSAAATYALDKIVTYSGAIYKCTTAITVPEAWNAAHWTAVDTTTIEARSYVCTYVTAYGEEGPPSPASALVNVAPGQTVALSGILGAPSGNYNITLKRIYRTLTGTSGTAFQRVAEIVVAQDTFSDTSANTELGEVLPSATWDAPPNGLKGMVNLPNGIIAGFIDNQVCFCEPYLPHAWPVDYRQPAEYPIVAIGAFGNSILVVTTGTPYVITGTHPSNMTMDKLEEGYACTSKRGLVDMGNAVIYPCPLGLMFVGTGSVRLITGSDNPSDDSKGILTQDEWKTFNPESINAYQYGGNYVGFYDNGQTQGGFVFNPSTLDFTLLNVYATAGYHDKGTGALYLQIGTNIVKWDSDATNPLTYTYRSRPFLSGRPNNYGVAKVVAEAYPVTFNMYCDGVLQHAQTVANDKPFRLPSAFLVNYATEIELTGTAGIKQVLVGETMKELRQ